MSFHDLEGVGSVHIPYNWTYADSAARVGATGLVAADVGKLARQLDDNSIWMLADELPVTWVQVSAGTGGILPHHGQHENGGSDEISVAGLSGELADAQPPKSHASTHQPGGGDAMTVDAAAVTGSLRTLGTGGQQACAGNDSRLSDARTPTSHKTSHQDGGTDELSVAGLSGELADAQTPKAHASAHQPGGSDAMTVDAAAVTGSLRTLGTGGQQACAGNDSRLSDARTPTSHKTSHENGGTDELSVAGLSGVLADEQNAGKIKGYDVTLTSLRNGAKLFWDDASDDWKNELLPVVPYGRVRGESWAPSWAELEAHGHAVFFNTSISVTSHVGNATVATLNGMSPTAGNSYTVTDTGTLSAGSVSVTPGAVVIWSGSAWVLVVPGSTLGFVRSGFRVQLSTTTALISPYTDGTDDGKIFAFDGTDLTGDEATADVTLTLPAPTGLPNDGLFRGPIYVGNFTGENTLYIDITSSGEFSDGLVSIKLDHDSESVMLGAVNGDTVATWMRISTVHHHLQVRRAATWASTNFSSATPVPFDTLDHEGNPELSYWGSPTYTTRLYAALRGTFHVSGFANIDSTGGFASWTLEVWLRVNGTTEIPGSRLRTGNYSSEDQSITLSNMTVELEEGDYVEWVFDHASLTGNLYSAMLEMERDY